MPEPAPSEPTYPVGAVARLTGVSPDLLRAWERRYRAVTPLRSPGGTRRYRAADVERLRLLKAAVDAGHRIGDLADLDAAALAARAAAAPREALRGALDAALDALERIDAFEAERLLSLQLAALGPVRFAREFALPLLSAIGEGWQGQRICIAAEHLGSALLRSLLGAALRPARWQRDAPRIVFATPSGERHEIGLLIAALAALGAGAEPLCLGPDLPTTEIQRAVARSGARALAIGLVALPRSAAEPRVAELRSALPREVDLWVGGSAAESLALPEGAQRIVSLDALEQRVELLRERREPR